MDRALVLKGNGDPTLSRADLRALAAQVKSPGIRSVTGGVAGDESAYDTRRIVAGWKPSFFIDESPPLSALVVDRARVGSVVTRTPALAAATAFRDALRNAGIAVDGPVRTAPADEWSELLASVSSPTLAAMVRFMDRESDNFTAEMLLKQLGPRRARSRHERRGRDGRHADARRGRRADDGRAHRRRLGPVVGSTV